MNDGADVPLRHVLLCVPHLVAEFFTGNIQPAISMASVRGSLVPTALPWALTSAPAADAAPTTGHEVRSFSAGSGKAEWHGAKADVVRASRAFLRLPSCC